MLPRRSLILPGHLNPRKMPVHGLLPPEPGSDSTESWDRTANGSRTLMVASHKTFSSSHTLVRAHQLSIARNFVPDRTVLLVSPPGFLFLQLPRTLSWGCSFSLSVPTEPQHTTEGFSINWTPRGLLCSFFFACSADSNHGFLLSLFCHRIFHMRTLDDMDASYAVTRRDARPSAT